MREDVSKLAIRELVHASRETDGEVAGDAGQGSEVERVNSTGRGLKATLRVLRGHPRRHAVSQRRVLRRGVKVNRGDAVGIGLAVELPDVRHLVQGYAHGNLELNRREVHTRDRLRHRMFHLQTRVHLQERVLARGDVVEVLHGAHAAVPNLLGEPDGAALELRAQLPRRHRHGSFLYDFLVPALHRAIASVKGDGVAVLVRHDLNLQVPGVGRELLDEHGRAGHLRLNLHETRAELLHVRHHADTLTAASFRGLDHQREPNLLGALLRLLQVPERSRQ